jgi:hypothetical protein
MNERFAPTIFTAIAKRLSEIKYAFSEESELNGAAPRMIGNQVLDI